MKALSAGQFPHTGRKLFAFFLLGSVVLGPESPFGVGYNAATQSCPACPGGSARGVKAVRAKCVSVRCRQTFHIPWGQNGPGSRSPSCDPTAAAVEQREQAGVGRADAVCLRPAPQAGGELPARRTPGPYLARYRSGS